MVDWFYWRLGYPHTIPKRQRLLCHCSVGNLLVVRSVSMCILGLAPKSVVDGGCIPMTDVSTHYILTCCYSTSHGRAEPGAVLSATESGLAFFESPLAGSFM